MYKFVINAKYGDPEICDSSTELQDRIFELLEEDGMDESEIEVYQLGPVVDFKIKKEIEFTIKA